MDQQPSLYDPSFEHDACGVGMIADLTGAASFATVDDALTILENLEHRGATGADVDSGDGAGILLQMPDAFVRDVFDVVVPDRGAYGLAQWMASNVSDTQRTALEAVFARVGLRTLGWRSVPVDSSVLGPTSRASEPHFVQQLLDSASGECGAALEHRLFCARKLAEHELDVYAASCSSQVLIYKGMLSSPQLRRYFADLRDSRLASAIAVVHSRFSTNTLPRWSLAQPFRFIAHNGEINTIRGNRNWMTARESTLRAPLPVEVSALAPIITDGLSDSASFDEVVELLVHGGRSLAHAVLMMIPEAWERSTSMDPARRAFYRYHAALMEPWDGPASVTFCDGHVVGAVLDRNGLRPARYWVTKDQRVILASEVGVLPIDPALIERKGRLQPGRVFLVDVDRGCIVDDDELKAQLAHAAPYERWLTDEQISLDDVPPRPMLTPSHASVTQRQRNFGYSEEDLRLILTPMALVGEEPVGSMGNDAALAVLSRQPRSLFDYFSQLFAQVTNPPLDAIREELVTSTRVALGGEENLLSESARHCHQVVLGSPVLSVEDLAKLRYLDETDRGRDVTSVAVDGLFAAHGEDPAGERLARAIDEVTDLVATRVREGASIVILSDRHTSPDDAAVPSLLLTAAVHNRLVRDHLRTRAALIVEAGDVREVHHVAALLGFGASAVCPYLAYESIDALVADGEIELDAHDARYQYAKALTKGVVKVMSKMGVSTVASYVGAQLFEAVGLSDDVLGRYVTGFHSRLGGATLDDVARGVLRWHSDAYGPRATHRSLTSRGEYQWRRDGEIHLFTPRAVHRLQHATRARRYDIFREYTDAVNRQEDGRVTLRSLLRLREAAVATPLDEVESAASIIARFSSGAMSYGSISAEAHETLAVAMNRLGAKSNTGEGGEDEERFVAPDPRHNRRSAIKQVASGRFGVTSRYLVNADDLQIKMAQGAKPGEGGQLPGHKVYPWIAETRFSTPGVGLISPPPHHDIYSIEDIAQLIHDLKSANPRARIHVKLVAEVGVGTVAAGVAKAHSDVVLISGHDGGTGASPLTSLKHAGIPWELGLAETQQILVANDLRDRIVVQVDGQMKTGRDVVVAALLGAEEYGFATAPLVVSGCIMMRVCHLDTCPVGIATQNPVLRKRFSGKPEFVETFFEYIAEEVREYLAALGLRSLEDAIGRVDLLDAVEAVDHWKASGLDLSPILAEPEVSPGSARFCVNEQDHGLDRALDHAFLDACRPAIEEGTPVAAELAISNVHRTVGTLLGYEVTRRHGGAGLPDGTIDLTFRGSAGQSFGAFVPRGITLRLFGDANDYLGKGLSGGRLVVRPPEDSPFVAEENIVAGNVILYGATSGEVFIRGQVGERFCVRNSGAIAVVEGVGDHGCEYMTGGRVVVLGPTGRNFGAGMSGGVAFVHDPDGRFATLVNGEMVELEPLSAEDRTWVRDRIMRHQEETGSTVAGRLLADWTPSAELFVKVMPRDYKRVLEATERAVAEGRSVDEAIMEASRG